MMKILVKTSFIVFLLFLLARHSFPMDPPELTLCLSPIRSECSKNGCPENEYLATQPLCDHLNFHDMRLYSQTNQKNNKIVKDYLACKPAVVGYFKELHQIIHAAPHLDQGKVWALAKTAAAYDLDVQSWILGYAKKYITDYFLVPCEEREISPRFHQWVYIIRSFQGCDVNFEADLFINTVLEKYLNTPKFNKQNGLNARNELKEQHHDFSRDPQKTIRYLQIIKFNSRQESVGRFIKNQNYFHFLWLYHSDRTIYRASYENFRKKCLDGSEMMKDCIHILLMRRTKKSIQTIINGLLIETEKEAFWWGRSAEFFLQGCNDWKFNLFLEDEDIRRGIVELRKFINMKCFLPASSHKSGRKAKIQGRRRKVSF